MTVGRLSRRQRRVAITTAVFVCLSIFVGLALVRLAEPDPGYRPGEELAGLTAQLERDLPPDHPTAVFVDVTDSAGIGFRHFPGKRTGILPEDMGSGAGWADYDGDGWLDLLLVNIGGPSRLYRNLGDGTFEDVTDAAGIDHNTTGMGVSWADYDGDGWTDVFLSSYGANVLYRNRGDGTFQDATRLAGMEGREGFWAGAAWGDYDRDGHLDLYVTGYVEYEPELGAEGSLQYDVEIPPSLNPSVFKPHENLLWRNRGDGTFEEVAATSGVRGEGRSLGAVWTDFDEDGWLDLYVANDLSDNVLYRNLRDGTFEDVSHQAAVADYRGAMGLAVGDWDGDEDLDLFITHWIAQENALFSNLGRDLTSAPGESRRLRFVDEADRVGLGQIALDFVGWGTSFFDYDHDGRVDLLVVNGSTLQRRDDPSQLVPMRDQLFWNRGVDEGFYEVSAVAGVHFLRELVGRGAAFGDYDRDGDVDVVIVNHGGRAALLRNEGGNEGSWLQLRLEGRGANRSAIGAHLRVVTGEVVQVRVVGAQTSYLSHNSARQHFGLGDASRVDTLTIRWPDGSRETWTNLPARRAVHIVQGSADWTTEWSETGSPGTAAFWDLYRLAGRHRVDGRLLEAAAVYEEALALEPRHESALYYLASVRLELGDHATADRILDDLLDIAPESARAHVQKGVLRACPGRSPVVDPKRARASFERAFSINPEETGPLLWLSFTALLEDDVLEAGRQLDRVLGTNPVSVPGMYLRGYVRWREGRNDDAEEAIRQTIELASKAPGANGLLEGDTRNSRPLFAAGMSCPWFEERLAWLARPSPASQHTAEALYRDLKDALLRASE